MASPFIAGWRFYLLGAVISMGFFAVLGRLYYLHIAAADHYTAIVERYRQKIIVFPAQRGNILDERGEILATTRPVIRLGVDPHELTEADLPKLPQLAALLGRPLADLKALCEPSFRGDGPSRRPVRWRVLAPSLDDEAYDAVRQLGIRAVYGNRHFERIYPSQDLAAHVIGFVNREFTPVMGVERSMDFYLRGQDGWRESERDGRKREIARFREREVPPVNGYNVQLSIDGVIQDAVETRLAELVEKHQPEGASIIVSEPRSGFILALANYPSFDPNRFFDFPVDAHRNRAVSDVFEPGSTFKIVPVAAALEEQLVSALTPVDCAAAVAEYAGRQVRLPEDAHPMETLSVAEVLSRSSNRGAAQLAILLGENRLHAWSRRFGFGQKLGFGPGGEVGGILHPVERWDGLTISRLPMGHAIGATPLQVHHAMSAIANGGWLMRPRLVRKVVDGNGKTIADFAPLALHRVLKGTTARTVAAMLQGAVTEDGTARLARIPGFAVAGKTGTTQKIINGRYSNRHHVASFSGFFPVVDPALVITVVVDNPQMAAGQTGYGGQVAAPVFSDLGGYLARYLSIPANNEETAPNLVRR